MKVVNLGLVDYKEALDYQLDCVKNLKEGKGEEVIIICHHPSVVTLGKKTQPTDVLGWEGDVYEISRGGRATYHGPGQVVAYPIVNLQRRNNDIYQYLRGMEEAMSQTLVDFGIDSPLGDPNNTGVWVGTKKIASIGVAIKRWITYHGLALNLFKDDNAFKGINPCGFSTDTMVSLEELLSKKVERSDFEEKLSQNLVSQFSNMIQ